jgi:hypothetical protein
VNEVDFFAGWSEFQKIRLGSRSVQCFHQETTLRMKNPKTGPVLVP